MRCGDLFSAQQHKTKIMEWKEARKEKPKDGLVVLTYDKDKNLEMGRFDGTFWVEQHKPYLNHNITHWAYLPNAPKKLCCDLENGCVCEE